MEKVSEKVSVESTCISKIMSLTRPDVNAKQMFFIGLFGLPWLWVVNVMYHFRGVYGNGNESTDGEGENDENAGILGGMMSESDDNGKLTRDETQLIIWCITISEYSSMRNMHTNWNSILKFLFTHF